MYIYITRNFQIKFFVQNLSDTYYYFSYRIGDIYIGEVLQRTLFNIFNKILQQKFCNSEICKDFEEMIYIFWGTNPSKE